MPLIKKLNLTMRKDLAPGTVFKYKLRKVKKILFVPPKHMLMPALISGERPAASNNPEDDSYVEILWTPQAHIKKLPQNTD
jgi:hypothetical protein